MQIHTLFTLFQICISLTPPAPPSRVHIFPDVQSVASNLFQRVEFSAKAAIKAKNHFALAIPGGSILKMLPSSPPSWCSHTTIVWVNHKCVNMDDIELSTHAKARKLFLDSWIEAGAQVIVLTGSSDAALEAQHYCDAIHNNPNIPKSSQNVPIFDMMLIGVGDDGHVGSLYPNHPAINNVDHSVLPVSIKTPGSITLSLPVMKAAKEVIIAAGGVSDKYPQGKSAGMARAIEKSEETTKTFPCVGLREDATWLIDEAAGSQLSSTYTESATATAKATDMDKLLSLLMGKRKEEEEEEEQILSETTD